VSILFAISKYLNLRGYMTEITEITETANALPTAKKSKYGNIKCEVDGQQFDSKAEGRRFRTLWMWQLSGAISDLELQVKYVLTTSKKRDDNSTERAAHYICDFQYRCGETGKLIVEDVKGGKATPEFILKRKMMLEKYGITIKEIRK
jgi:hypothetical protein